MLKKIIRRFIRPRHYWRDLGFDELSELYTSMMFRSLAMSLVGIFVPIYLYQQGYFIWQVFMYYYMLFSFSILIIYPIAKLIAKVGPKHTILASYVFQVMFMLQLVTLENLKWPLLTIAAAQSISAVMFFTAFHVDFSKIKHSEHGGKEVGWMYTMERVGAILGPIVGGLTAYFIGAEYMFLVAAVLLFAGVVPLFMTKEPTAVNQHIDFRALHIKDVKHDLVAQGFFQIEAAICLLVWPLYVGVFVFNDNPYLKLGIIMSASVLVSIFIARAIGRRIDRNKGRAMLRLGATLNAVLHLFRPFTGGFTGAFGINLVNEVLTPAYRMPYIKGMYDAADDLPGRRIVYIASMEVAGYVARALLFLTAAVIAYISVDSEMTFTVIFVIASIASLGIMLEKFNALNVRA